MSADSVRPAHDPVAPPADTKDWTFTATQPCGQCGYDPSAVPDEDIAQALRDTFPGWNSALNRATVRQRPAPEVWSALEYACHVRDVNRIFAGRVQLMLTEDAPEFASWSGDDAAVEGRYFDADPRSVTGELQASLAEAAAAYDAVPADGWSRTGVRGDGGEFTISSLGHYHLHDVTHHLWDVNR